jgi:RNA polymerase sigma factor (sigma-70 family)
VPSWFARSAHCRAKILTARNAGAGTQRHTEIDELFLGALLLAKRAAQVRFAGLKETLRSCGIERDDLEQEVSAGVWRALFQFDPLRASLATFVENVVASRTASLVRRVRARKRTPPMMEQWGVNPMNVMVIVDRHLDIRRALRTLSTSDQVVARLRLNYGPTEIARMLRWSRNAVYRSIDRIRAALREADLEKY